MLPEKPWKAEAVLRLLVGLFAAILLGGLIVSWMRVGAEEAGGETRFSSFLVATLTFHGAGLVLISVFLREHGLGWAEGFGFRMPRIGRALFLGAMSALAVLPIAWILSQFSGEMLTRFDYYPEPQEAVQTLQTTVTTSQRIYFGFAAVLLAPCVEEAIFRGILYPAIKQGGYPKLALWGTSLLFAATHGNVMTFVPLVVLAVVLTLLYETTGNLLASIFAHSLFNAANFFWLVMGTIP